MIIVIDTREQTPLLFGDQVETVPGTLETGDYSIQGLTDLVTIERKSLPDLLGCIGKGRDRFERELRRMRGYTYKAVVIEATLKQCAGGSWRGEITPAQLLGSIASWRVKYKVDFIYAGNAELAAEETLRVLRKFNDYCLDFARRFK